MPLFQQNLVRHADGRLEAFLRRISAALLSAFTEESERCAHEAAHSQARNLLDELPDPPHLEYGEVRYRNGQFKYLDS